MSKTAKGDKKENILQAAVQVFSRKNFYLVKMQEVADAAGVGKGTIYEYFSSKEDLFSQMIKNGIDHYKKIISLDKMKGEDLWSSLEALLKANISFIWENQDIARLILTSEHPFHRELHNMLIQFRESIINDMEKGFEKAREKGEIKKVSPKMAARMFRGIIIEVFSAMILFEGKKPGDQEIKESLSLFRQGLENWD